MATRYPPEFRQRAVELARLREKPITRLAQDLGISDRRCATGSDRRTSTKDAVTG